MELHAEFDDPDLFPPFFVDAAGQVVLGVQLLNDDFERAGTIHEEFQFSPPSEWDVCANRARNYVLSVSGTSGNPMKLQLVTVADAGWTDLTAVESQLTSDSSQYFQLLSARADRKADACAVVLTQEYSDGSTRVIGLRLPLIDMAFELASMASTVLESYPPIDLGEYSGFDPQYTRDGFVVRSGGEEQLIGFDGEVKASRQLPDDFEQERYEVSYDISGTYRYVLDTEKGRMLKYRVWW